MMISCPADDIQLYKDVAFSIVSGGYYGDKVVLIQLAVQIFTVAQKLFPIIFSHLGNDPVVIAVGEQMVKKINPHSLHIICIALLLH